MCDLIDFNSPDSKNLVGTKLASPLIPVPTNTEQSDNNPLNTINCKTRNSLENNPFDKVLHETTEYVRKKDDPFEMVLEKALKSEKKKERKPRFHSIDFTDDFSPKCRKRVQSLKVNKTLDEARILPVKNEENIINLSNSDSNSNNNKAAGDLSILSLSSMNDTFSENSINSDENQIKSVVQQKSKCIQKSTNIGKIAEPNQYLKAPGLHRSYSQGDRRSPKKSSKSGRSYSIIDSLRMPSITDVTTNTVSSIISDDPLNEGFLKSQCSNNSVFSSLSSISPISKLRSLSVTCNSSSMLSDGTMNKAFLNSVSSDRSTTDESRARSVSTTLSLCSTSTARSDVSDIVQRYNKLRIPSSEIQVPIINITEENIYTESNNVDKSDKSTANICVPNCSNENKLIDVDVFVPEKDSSDESQKSFVSTASNDSVFSEQSKINKMISYEAKALARTFEELAQTEMSASTDDFLSSNSSWISELQPAFEDEDDLIVLPTSPTINQNNTPNSNSENQTDQISPCVSDIKSNSNEKSEKDITKSLEAEFVDSPSQKKVDATTLLSDLKKLINQECKPEANKLVEKLETALGVKYKNNTELLATCLQGTNNLTKSPQKSENKVEIIENVKEEKSINNSHEDNATIDSVSPTVEKPKDAKEINSYDNYNLNNLNIADNGNQNSKTIEKIDKSIEIIDLEKEEEEVPDSENSKNHNNGLSSTKNNVDAAEEKKSCDSESTAVMELLINLGKLLSSDSEKSATMNLIKNLGMALNSVSNSSTANCDKKKNATPIKKPNALKGRSRFSLNMDSKGHTTENVNRRSISVSPTTPNRTAIPCSPISKNKCQQLKDTKKRFSSDPGFMNCPPNRKIISEKKSLDANKKDTNIKKDITKPVAILDLKKPNVSLVVDNVKNKLKKKCDLDNKRRGPLKAVLPLGKMQRKGSADQVSAGSITPPNAKKTVPIISMITSSTPNSDREVSIKQSPKSKPVASSTPDTNDSRTHKSHVSSAKTVKKRFSCDISPVINKVDNSGENCASKDSPKRANKTSSPKRSTFKNRQDSNIPKYLTSPSLSKKNMSFNRSQEAPESPQRSGRKMQSSQRSPVSLKKTEDKRSCDSPLRNSNKIFSKTKGVNLISKMRRSTGSTSIDKENNYV